MTGCKDVLDTGADHVAAVQLETLSELTMVAPLKLCRATLLAAAHLRAHAGASQHHDDKDIGLRLFHTHRSRAPFGLLRSHTLATLCVLLCLDSLCVALFVRPNGHPELDQALATARGVQDGPRATAGRRWPKTVGQTSL